MSRVYLQQEQTPKDLALQLWVQSFEERELKLNGWTEDKLLELSSRANKETLRAEGDAVSSVLFYETIAQTHYEILFLATAPQYRRKGHLFQLLQSFLLEKAPCVVWLESRQDNLAALNLYKKCGFREVGLRRKYYKDGMSATLMSYSSF